MQVGPQDVAVYVSRCLQEVMMIVPIDSDVDETQNITEKYWP
jgi:hypothetical protein